jgi:hypothetical protein
MQQYLGERTLGSAGNTTSGTRVRPLLHTQGNELALHLLERRRVCSCFSSVKNESTADTVFTFSMKGQILQAVEEQSQFLHPSVMAHLTIRTVSLLYQMRFLSNRRQFLVTSSLVRLLHHYKCPHNLRYQALFSCWLMVNARLTPQEWGLKRKDPYHVTCWHCGPGQRR